MKKFEKILSVVLCTVLVLAMSICLAGCGNTDEATLTPVQEAEIDVAVNEIVDAIYEDEATEEVTEEVTEESTEEADTENVEEADEENVDKEEIIAEEGEAVDESIEWTQIGEGSAVIYFVATVSEEDSRYFEILTDAETVGAALLENGLIEGEDSEYGLYVKTVDGVTADYDVDGTYWAFYVNGEYAMTGVDSTPVEADSTYEFVIEK